MVERLCDRAEIARVQNHLPWDDWKSLMAGHLPIDWDAVKARMASAGRAGGR